MGSNLRRAITWAPLINTMQNRLQGWRNKYLSFSGRVILINAVLSSLAVYYLSFYKVLKKVINNMVQIQRRFLWGGNDECRKICWVNLDLACKKREEGGLGIRNIKAFNFALLGKWRWRFFMEPVTLWSRILRVRYGVPCTWTSSWQGKTIEGGEGSYWWNDLGRLEGEKSIKPGWLSNGLSRVVGNGESLPFWT